MKNLLGIVVLSFFLSGNAFSANLKCSSLDDSSTTDIRVRIDLDRNRIDYAWLGKPMKIISKSGGEIDATLKAGSLNWFLNLDLYTGVLRVQHDSNSKLQGMKYKTWSCKKAKSLLE